ncbi:hypothetical protein NP233_g3396 [Leucocoprinus birnbaumii]|uniref:F-box domain-containing protein n=1 Tax=Leucocoprinus birnbaumii TaxID=56174 RepID=A0AAD5YSV8_9AGAR|nr:hypothetical protein NP233_g3396 [Leucocoprinus birnbaumii]
MSRNCAPTILTPFSSVHSGDGHPSLLGYFLFDRPEEIPDIPRFHCKPSLHVDLPPYPPIDSLPNEILSQIFESGYFEGEDFDLHFRGLIEQVSQRWREAAYHTPALWSNYNLSQGNLDQFIDVLPTFLERSGDYPLDIHLNCFWDPARTKAVMKQFLPHSRRWRSLSITTPGADIFRYLHRVPAPLLQTLQVCHFSSQRFLPMDPELFDGHLPSLRHLVLRNVSLEATTLPLKSLHSLDVRGYGVWPEHEALEELIGGSTELRQLTLHGCPLTLATLSRFFSCPSLDTFTVKDSSASADAPTHDMVRYSRTGSDAYPDSPSLRVKACSLYHAWRSLSFARKITTLELDDVHWPHWSNCMTVFSDLPILRNMAITNVDASTALAELGKPTSSLKVESLSKLQIGFNRHRWSVVEADFAKFVTMFEVPQLKFLAIRDISWQQWKFLVLSFTEKVEKYPILESLTLTNLRGLTHSLPDPSSAFPNLQNLNLIRTAAEPLLEHLAIAHTPSWLKLRSLSICGDPRANLSLLRRVVALRPKTPLSLILDTHFQSDRESWNWLKENVDVVLMPSVQLW